MGACRVAPAQDPMLTIANHLPIRPEAYWTETAARAGAFAATIRDSNPEIRTLLLPTVSDAEAA